MDYVSVARMSGFGYQYHGLFGSSILLLVKGKRLLIFILIHTGKVKVMKK
jgi:hypothetical protein